jgi:Mrp family chromosome partitioning ATPase
MDLESMNDTTDALAILAPIWRRKWFILIVAVLVAAGSYLYYKHQPQVFKSTTELYLLAGSEEQQAEKGGRGRSSLNAAAQAQLITSVVHEFVKRELHKEKGKVAKSAAKGKARAKASEKSAFITITTEAHSAKGAALLANTLARAYIGRQHAQFMRGLRRTISIAQRQLRRIETPHKLGARGGKNGGGVGVSATQQIQVANLNSKINQLESQLNVKAVQQIKPAKPNAAVQLAPHPRKNAKFGFVIGLILASLAAFLLNRLDRRLRTVQDVESALEAPVIAVVPQVKKPIVTRDGAPAPARALLESLRKLDVTLKLPAALNGTRTAAPKSILFIGVEAGEGTSSVVAGLALAEREAGGRTALIDANLRRPVQGSLLGLTGTRGLLDVIAGAVPLSAVAQPVAQPAAVSSSPPSPEQPQTGGAGGAPVATALAQVAGTLSVLVANAGAPNPQALLASPAMSTVLEATAEENEHVLIDSAPLLEVSDAIPLLPIVDGIVIVVRLGHTSTASAARMRQQLGRTSSAPVLGVVANGATRKEVGKQGVAGAKRWRLLGR